MRRIINLYCKILFLAFITLFPNNYAFASESMTCRETDDGLSLCSPCTNVIEQHINKDKRLLYIFELPHEVKKFIVRILLSHAVEYLVKAADAFIHADLANN